MKQITSKELNALVNETIDSYSLNIDNLLEQMRFTNQFYQYSYRNQILIKLQNPYARYCGSYVALKDLGFQVNKGEKAIKILTPSKSKFVVENGATIFWGKLSNEKKEYYKNNPELIHEKLSFRRGHIFDISQTTGREEDLKRIFEMGEENVKAEQAIQELIEITHTEGISVSEDRLTPELRGYYSYLKNDHEHKGNITLNDLTNGEEKFTTLSHEIGHSIHNINDNEHHRTASDYEHELYADLVSVLLHQKYNLEIPNSSKLHLQQQYNGFLNQFEDEEKYQEVSSFLERVIKNYHLSFDKHFKPKEFELLDKEREGLKEQQMGEMEQEWER